MNTLKAYIKDCNAYIVADALLNKATIEFFKNTHDHNTIVVENKFQSFTNINCSLVKFCKIKENMISYVFDRLNNNKKIVIPTNSLKKANELSDIIKHKFSDKKVGLITSETEPIQTHLWIDYDIIIYSPTVLAGNSFNEIHFDELIGFFTNMSCGVNPYLQMLLRVRNLKDNQMTIFYDERQFYTPATNDLIDLDIKNKDDLLQVETGLNINVITSRVIKNDYYKLYRDTIRTNNLSKNRAIDVLVGLFNLHGMKWSIVDNIQAVTKEDNLEIGQVISNGVEERFNKMMDTEIINSSEYERIKDSNNATIVERLQVKKFLFHTIYNINPREIVIDFQFYNKFKNLTKQWSNVKILNEGMEHIQSLIDMINDRHNEEPNTVETLHFDTTPLKIKTCYKLVKAIGFEDLFDTTKIKTYNHNGVLTCIQENINAFTTLFPYKRLVKIKTMNIEKLTPQNKQDLSGYSNEVLKGVFGDGGCINGDRGGRNRSFWITGINGNFTDTEIITIPKKSNNEPIRIINDFNEFRAFLEEYEKD